MIAVSKAYIGLGTNLGDRIQNLSDARKQLQAIPACLACRCSSFYLSSPVGYQDQKNFINSAIEMEFSGTVTVLFRAMQMIEKNLGRVRDPDNRNAPRLIDLDLLAFGELEMNTQSLTVPHPRLAQRLFVLRPLLELNPEIALPGFGKLNELTAVGHKSGLFTGQVVHRLGGQLSS